MDEQKLQELQQRINAKAEDLVKIKWTNNRQNRRIPRWLAIAILAAFLIVVEGLGYSMNRFWEFNAYLCIFIITFFIGYYLMTLIMRHFLTTMKNASTPSQHYRAVKRLITTHKLRNPIPMIPAFLCSVFVWPGPKSGDEHLYYGILIACVIGATIGDAMRNWNLDDDFCDDVEELGDLIKQERAE